MLPWRLDLVAYGDSTKHFATYSIVPQLFAQKGSARLEEKDVALRLRYRPPYDWNCMLGFLRARAVPGVEIVDGGRYLRTVEVDGAMGSIESFTCPIGRALVSASASLMSGCYLRSLPGYDACSILELTSRRSTTICPAIRCSLR